jgi:hypothetical protein
VRTPPIDSECPEVEDGGSADALDGLVLHQHPANTITASAAPATCFSLRERGTVGRAARPSVNSQRWILERHPPRIFPDGGHARAFPHGGGS